MMDDKLKTELVRMFRDESLKMLQLETDAGVITPLISTGLLHKYDLIFAKVLARFDAQEVEMSEDDKMKMFGPQGVDMGSLIEKDSDEAA